MRTMDFQDKLLSIVFIQWVGWTVFTIREFCVHNLHLWTKSTEIPFEACVAGLMAIGFLGLKFWKDFNVSRSSFPDLLVWEGCGVLMTIFPLELAETMDGLSNTSLSAT